MNWNDGEAMKAQRYEAMTVQQQRLEAMKLAQEQLANEQARQEAERRPWDAVPHGEELHAPGAIGTLCAQTTHNGGTGGRYFTREEVLLMLRALRAAMHDHHAPTLNSIERMFERME